MGQYNYYSYLQNRPKGQNALLRLSYKVEKRLGKLLYINSIQTCCHIFQVRVIVSHWCPFTFNSGNRVCRYSQVRGNFGQLSTATFFLDKRILTFIAIGIKTVSIKATVSFPSLTSPARIQLQNFLVLL